MTARPGESEPVATDLVAADLVAAGLIAVLVAVPAEAPRVLTLAGGRSLPSGPFTLVHRSLQAGLRDWVETQTGHRLGYVEQLYTFADAHRAGGGGHAVSISYLGLTREAGDEPGWRGWYEYFPWEDHRDGAPGLLAATILPRLADWAGADALRRQRIGITFGLPWNEELVLQRYELLWEAGLVAEAGAAEGPGVAMAQDHRRILATAIARLRAKIKYRPVVFELMPPEFTLLQLQRRVEAIAGRRLHKQNFRRLIEQQELVEETGGRSQASGGRPARLHRFRGTVIAERHVAGSKLPPPAA